MLELTIARRACPEAAGISGTQPLLIHKTMRCLTSSEIHKWLAGQGMHHQPLDCGVPVAGDFPIPSDRRERLQLADYLSTLLTKDGNKLIEVLPKPQIQASDWEIMDRFRASLDEKRKIVTAPGHLFKSRDRDACNKMLSTLLGFSTGWTFYIYAAPSRTTILVSDRIQIWSPKKGLRNELGRHLSADVAA